MNRNRNLFDLVAFTFMRIIFFSYFCQYDIKPPPYPFIIFMSFYYFHVKHTYCLVWPK